MRTTKVQDRTFHEGEIVRWIESPFLTVPTLVQELVKVTDINKGRFSFQYDGDNSYIGLWHWVEKLTDEEKQEHVNELTVKTKKK
jgi:hypothetical protein